MASFLFRCLPAIAVLVMSLSILYKDLGLQDSTRIIGYSNYISVSALSHYLECEIGYHQDSSLVEINMVEDSLKLSFNSNIITFNNNTLISRKPLLFQEGELWVYEEDWEDLINLLRKNKG